MIKIFGSVLLFFYNICNSYGGAILLFGLLVKLIMLPFQMKSKHSMMRTTMLTPRVKELGSVTPPTSRSIRKRSPSSIRKPRSTRCPAACGR